MKTISRLIFVSAFFLLSSLNFANDTLSLLSINVRYGSANDGENRWENRKDFLLDIVRRGEYDFIGGQEVLVSPNSAVDQLGFLRQNLPDYGIIVRSREASETAGESTPIFYRKSRFEPDTEEQGTFWLSDTPNVPGSNTWNAACCRVASYALFHEIDAEKKRTGKKVYVYNTHFDHIGREAREKSALLIGKYIAERKERSAPIVLMGDFNSGLKSPVIQFFLGEDVSFGKTRLPLIDTFFAKHPDETFVVTYNSFSQPNKDGQKIDYIFVLPNTEVKDAAINREKRDGRYPTDHFPISATIKF